MGSRSDAGGASGGLGVSFVSAFGAGNADDDDDGVATPDGFQNTPDQWHSAAAQKKRGVSDTLAGAATQRDSQATQIATEVQSFDTQAVRADGGGPAWSHGPSFVNATGSLSGSADGSGTDRRLDDVDEDETQIIMSLSQEPGALRKAARHIEEEQLEAVTSLPQLSHADAAVATGEASDADSDMSDDMLEKDGDVNGLSSIAKNFQLSEAELLQEKKPAGNVYKPRMPFQITPPTSLKGDGSADDDESSGAETEVDEEPETTTETFGTSKTEVGEMPSVKIGFVGKRSVSDVAVSQPEEKRPRRSGVLERSASCSDVEATPERMKRARISLAKPADGKPPRPRAKRLHLDSGQDASLSHKDSAAKKDIESRSTSSSQETDTGTEASIDDTAVLDDQYSEAIVAPTTPSKRPITSVSKGAASQETSAMIASRTTPKSGRKRKVSKEANEEGTQEAAGAIEPALHVAATTLSAGPSIRVMFTGLDGTIPKLRDKVKRIADACQEDDDIEIVTHLVAPKNQLKRTVKLLCGISLCDHILDERWLDESARSGVPASETLHCLKDTAAEAKWHFSLYRTMYTVPKAQRRKLFDGLHFFITNHKSILPPVKDLVRIVECAGGHANMKGVATAHDIVITSETALPLAATKKAMANAAPDRIYTPEFILSSILQQKIDYDVNRLSPVEASEAPGKKKQGRK